MCEGGSYKGEKDLSVKGEKHAEAAARGEQEEDFKQSDEFDDGYDSEALLDSILIEGLAINEILEKRHIREIKKKLHKLKEDLGLMDSGEEFRRIALNLVQQCTAKMKLKKSVHKPGSMMRTKMESVSSDTTLDSSSDVVFNHLKKRHSSAAATTGEDCYSSSGAHSSMTEGCPILSASEMIEWSRRKKRHRLKPPRVAPLMRSATTGSRSVSSISISSGSGGGITAGSMDLSGPYLPTVPHFELRSLERDASGYSADSDDIRDNSSVPSSRLTTPGRGDDRGELLLGMAESTMIRSHSDPTHSSPPRITPSSSSYDPCQKKYYIICKRIYDLDKEKIKDKKEKEKVRDDDADDVDVLRLDEAETLMGF